MKSDEEKFCSECGTVIPRTADVCPACGARQGLPPIAQPPKTTSGFMGCFIAAIAAFFGIIIIGIIAAIAIPKFANTKEKAYIAEMKSDLRNLVTAESSYRAEHGSYTATTDSLTGFTFSEGVGLAAPMTAGPDGFSAAVRRRGSGVRCTIAVGNRASADTPEGVPTCGR